MNPAEYARRRKRVLEAIHPGTLLVVATPVALRNNDVEHEYRQDSDLLYLTGFEEPQSALLLSSTGETPCVMFVRPRDAEREVWDGPRAGVEGAVRDWGADVAHPWGELSEKLPDLLKDTPRLFYRLGRSRACDDIVLAALDHLRARAREGVSWPTEIVEPSMVVHEMRLIKSEPEIELMTRAAAVSCEAHLISMAKSKPGMHEYEVEALLRAHFYQYGGRPAYAPVVGSGPNATVLHYRGNQRQMKDGDLLLVDAGCKLGYYAADLTRTFPVNGRFTQAQAAIYDIVLAAQRQAIEEVRPGATLQQVHQAALTAITEGLIELGIITGPGKVAVEEERYKPYFMHRSSHFIGMDVHDVGRPYLDGESRTLEEGMVITVEPGLYVAETATDAPEQYRGIGVRIEDDALVTADGSRLLGEDLPKRREDIERACAG